MPDESQGRAALRLQMKAERKRRGLTQADIMGDSSKRYAASKVESGSDPLSREMVERYARLLEAPALLREFDHLVAVEAEAPPAEVPPLGALFVSVALTQVVSVGMMMRVEEQRTVIARLHAGQWTKIGLRFPLKNGRRRSIKPVTARGAHIVDQGWVSETIYLVLLRFPEEALKPGRPFTYDLTWEFESGSPSVLIEPGNQLTSYELTVRFPSDGYYVYVVDGLASPFAAEQVDVLERGDGPVLRSSAVPDRRAVTRHFGDLKAGRTYGLMWSVGRRVAPVWPPVS